MKELKDYLPLYIGQFVYIFPDETLTNGWLKAKLIDLPDLRWKLEVTPDTLAQRIADNYKLILRPLEEMSAEEQTVYAQLGDYDFNKSHKRNDFYLLDKMAADQVRWALSKGFDLFGLKDAGIAIYE